MVTAKSRVATDVETDNPVTTVYFGGEMKLFLIKALEIKTIEMRNVNKILISLSAGNLQLVLSAGKQIPKPEDKGRQLDSP